MLKALQAVIVLAGISLGSSAGHALPPNVLAGECPTNAVRYKVVTDEMGQTIPGSYPHFTTLVKTGPFTLNGNNAYTACIVVQVTVSLAIGGSDAPPFVLW
jgi:hypothetical protein